MHARHAHRSCLVAVICALVSLSVLNAQNTLETEATRGAGETSPHDVLQLSGGPSLPSTSHEVTAEELKSLRPAATPIGDGIEQPGEPLSAANSPRSTSSSRTDSHKPIARPSEPQPSGSSPETTGQLVARQRNASGGSWFSIRDFLPLAIVLALIFALAWIIRRFKPAQAMLGGGGVLEVVARLPVSGKQTLLLVRMGRQLVLLGQSQDSLTMLSEVNDPEEVAAIIGEAVSRTNQSLSHEFADTFESEATLYEHDLDPAERARGHVSSLINRVRQLTRTREVA